MAHKVQGGFSILLPEGNTFYTFGGSLKLLPATSIPQEHQRPILVLNLSTNPNIHMPSVNDTIDRKVVPTYMKFRRALPCIIWKIWYLYLDQ